jgi:hypothetical protein
MARKLVGFDPKTLRALDLLSSDSGRSLQQLAEARSLGRGPSPAAAQYAALKRGSEQIEREIWNSVEAR